jgi:WS/DGAT/MGAT family acyltransferase
MKGEPLSAEDAALLYAEAPGTQLQIGALCFFEAGPLRDRRGRLRRAALRSHVWSRLGTLPRFRQRIAPVLGDVAAPMWVDDTDFDIARHTRWARLPADGGAAALRDLVGRLLAEPLDPDHPLWDLHVVEGIDSAACGFGDVDVIAVIVRAHHVMADGIALHAAATLLLDPAPHRYRYRRHEWTPTPPPGRVALTASALAERLRRRAHLGLGVARALVDPRQTVRSTRRVAGAVGAVARGAPRTAPKLTLTQPIGPRRAFSWTMVAMDDIVAIKQACGATVNDVVLAIVAGALRRRLEANDSFDAGDRPPRALVPVGAPGSDVTALRNRFSITTVSLPVHVDDPLERVRLVHAQVHSRAAETADSLMPHVFSIVDFVPPPILRTAAPRVLARQPWVNLAITNIPGSRAPLYLWESRMLALHPFVDVVGNLALIVGVLSYVDDLGVGITVDLDVVGDPGTFAAHLDDAAAELVACVR